METIVTFFVNTFGTNASGFGREILVFLLSCLPILELRGGLLAASLLGLHPVTSYILCVLGNILPIPFILWLLESIFSLLKKTRFKKFVNKIEKKANSKKDSIEKYGFWGLVLFIGIPLPGTGAWTGNIIAVMLGMDKKKAFRASILGVLMASVIMMFISFGFLKIFI
jgi:uncharacterized membrane protein